jgi:hypothetical protein
MTISDKWLLERAQKEKAKAVQAQKAPVLKSLPPIDDLWTQLQAETKRQASVYTTAFGDPNALVITTTAETIEVSVPDGRKLTLKVDRQTRKLSETFRDRTGGVRIRRPLISFTRDEKGKAAFNFGGVPGAAGSLVRRMIG